MVEVTAARRFRTVAFLSSGSAESDHAKHRLALRYGNMSPERADVIVALGGDGLMLQVLHRFMGSKKPIYGMNRGSVGFLMNEFQDQNLFERLDAAETSIVHPLVMRATSCDGTIATARAINEVSMLRQSYQAAKLRVSIDGRERLAELIADGIMGGDARGFHGLQPVGQRPDRAAERAAPGADAHLGLPAAPLARARCCPNTAAVTIHVLEAEKRPVAATADHFELKNVATIDIAMDHATGLTLLHDPGHSLDERIIGEQFGA